MSNVKAEANVKPAGSSQFGKPESEPVVLALEGMGVPQTIDGTETATLENTCGVIDLGTTEGISKTRVAVGEGKERKGIAGNCHPPLEEDGPETFGRTGMLEGVTPGGKVKVEVLVKVIEGVIVSVGVSVAVALAVGVSVEVDVAVGVSVSVGEAVNVGVGGIYE